MTNEQYEKYKEIETEIKPLKEFLSWSGKLYKDENVGLYSFSLKWICKKFVLYMNRQFCTIPDNTYELPLELRDRIIEVIEKYVEEKEQEMTNI